MGELVIFKIDTSGFGPVGDRLARMLQDYCAPTFARRAAEAAIEVERGETRRQLERMEGDVEIARRAELRVNVEQIRQQRNIEAIAGAALPDLESDAQPEGISADWLSRFFDRCRNVSDEQMQTMWAKIFAGEVNKPGTFSAKTVDTVGAMGRRDAERFTRLCSFVWLMEGLPRLLIYEPVNQTLALQGLTYHDLLEMADIGLVRVQLMNNAAFEASPNGAPLHTEYFGERWTSTAPASFNMGRATLTVAGEELFRVAGGCPSPQYLTGVMQMWSRLGHVVEMVPK